MIKPYYQKEGVTIYCGDCREILPQLGLLESVITDPIWPGTVVNFGNGNQDPADLFREMCLSLPAETKRLVVQLGCDTDPRFLQVIPQRWPFLRICFLDYTVPHYKGRILYTGDVAYAFGRPPASIPGRHLIASGCRSSISDRQFMRHTSKHRRRTMEHLPEDDLGHPTPRRLEHVRWLVHQFSDNAVCDPFMGSGTTAVASQYLNREFIGIEIKEEYCEIAVERCRQMVMDLRINNPL